MISLRRLEAAKQAAVTIYEFCMECKIPVLIYGDTADRSPIERMSVYSYIDWEEPGLNDKYSLMAIQSHSNNRDGIALRILAEKLVKMPQTTKLLTSVSDGQPKAMSDYTGKTAIDDMIKRGDENYGLRTVWTLERLKIFNFMSVRTAETF